MNRISEFYQRYESILHSDKSSYDKDVALARLMTDMEYQFSIPVLHDPEWEQTNEFVSLLYRTISESRATV